MKNLLIILTLCFLSSLALAGRAGEHIFTFVPQYFYDKAVTFDWTDNYGNTSNLQLWARPDKGDASKCYVDCAGSYYIDAFGLKHISGLVSCMTLSIIGLNASMDKVNETFKAINNGSNIPGNREFLDLYNKIKSCSIDGNKEITWPFYDEVKQSKNISYRLIENDKGEITSVTRIK